MEKKSLKLAEFYQLEAELNGVVNTQTGEKIVQGLLTQKLPLNVKYWLNDMSKRVSEVKKECESLREELIKKFGEEKDGSVQIPFFVKDEEGNDVQNQKLIDFQNEYASLLNEERELEYKQIKLSDIGNLETEETYEKLFSLLNVE